MRTTLLSLLLFVALPVGARADLQLFTRMGARQIADPRFALVSETDTSFRAELGIGYEFDDYWGVELTTAMGANTAPLFDEFAEASLSLTELHANGIVQTPLLPPLLRGYLRAGVGVEFAYLEFREPWESGVSDLAVVPTFLGAGGLRLRLQPASDDETNEHLAFEISAEGGYLLAPFRADFSAVQSEREDAVPAGSFSAGRLDLSGWIVQLGLGLRF